MMSPNTRRICTTLSWSLALIVIGGSVGAQSFSHILSFQGRLCGTDGKPVPDGPYIVTFRMYASAAGGAALWTENQGVTQVGGVFVAYLGSVTAFPGNLFSDGDRWLGITVGGDPEMPDRFRLTPSPWAMRAAEADHAANADQATSAQNADKVDNIHAAVSPTANYLLALDGSGKFPNSVLRTGSGNGLDADLLDGQHGSFYRNASNLNAGTLPDGRLAGTYSQALTFPNPSNSFTGNGAGLLGLNASNLASGTVPDARLGGNVALLNTVQTFTADKYFAGMLSAATLSVTGNTTLSGDLSVLGATTLTGLLTANGGITTTTLTTSGLATLNRLLVTNNATIGGTLSANGSGLTNLNASSLASGTVPDARLGANVALLNTTQTFTANKTFTGTVGIGATAGYYPLSVQTNSDAVGSRAISALAGSTGTGQQLWGVFGETCSTAYSNAGAGVCGFASAATGASAGVRGDTISSQGIGVGANAWSTTGTTYGVLSHCYSPDGYAGYFAGGRNYFSGEVGIGNSAPFAMLTVNSSEYGSPGIVSTHTATSSDEPAIMGVHNVSDFYGIGVMGIGGYRGVVGQVAATGSQTYSGIAGSATGGSGLNYGVYGVATGGATSVGVYGYAYSASSANYAGYFNGNVVVTGTLSKGGGSFKIDHPLDPENKYLSHSFVESPDMKNIYDGVVVTDGRGYAIVTLPDWFDALNRDFRYQLTVIDDSDDFIMAKVTREIEGNHFAIRTNAPCVKVSWQVTGIRQDAYANLHRIPVEEDKPPSERGLYLHPDAYGQPEEYGIGFIERPEPAACKRQRPGPPWIYDRSE
jgi:hypothetical protein